MSVRKASGITLKGLNISKGAGKLVRRKVDVRTVCIALEVDADASEKMHRTRRLYGQACDLLVPRFLKLMLGSAIFLSVENFGWLLIHDRYMLDTERMTLQASWEPRSGI